MKFPRTVRFDASDSQVFARSAEPGEWAVPGSFEFLDTDQQQLDGKRLQAFSNGFLGTETFGWSSLVEIAEISDNELQQVIERLARHFIQSHGAPDHAAALAAARDEAHYAGSACEYPLHTLLAIEREFGDEGIVESLKVIQQRSADDHDRIKLWGVDENSNTL